MLLIAVVPLLVLTTGCGGGSKKAAATPTSTPAPPDVVRFCTDVGAGWRPAPVPGVNDDVATLGEGPVVVLANESDNDPCEWMAEARELSESGYRAVVFRYIDAEDEDGSLREALAVARSVAGDDKALMIGASIGGRLVLRAAAAAPEQLAGVVSLSGERRIEDLPDISREVARIRIPLLYLGSRGDPLTQGARQPRQLEAVTRTRAARFRLFPGSGHGVQLLGEQTGPAARQEINQFLDAHR